MDGSAMTTSRKLKFGEAISEATVQAMTADPNVLVMGIGVADVRGIFGTTLAAHQQFGSTRVLEMPACENAMTGMAIGAATSGKRPILVHARDDFMFLALDQLINLAAKWRGMFADERGVPVVSRGIIGRGWGQGATHSQSLQATFAHFPGLHVAMPACARDAKGLLLSALKANVPTVILEHRSLFDHEDDVPEGLYETPWGVGRIVREGRDVTVVGASLMAFEALRAAEMLAGHGVSVEVIDPRTIRPLDRTLIVESIRKTGRVVVADTSWSAFGFGAEVAALAAERAFPFLKAPVRRIGPLDCAAPVSRPLEEAFHPTPRTIAAACLSVLGREHEGMLDAPRAEAAFQGPY